MAVSDETLDAKNTPADPLESAREQTERELRDGVDARLDQQEKKDPILAGIECIDATVPILKQHENMENLEVVLDELILLALKAGEKKEDLLKSPLTLQGYAKNRTALAAISKYNELLTKQSTDTLIWWKENLEEGSERYDDVVEADEKTKKGEKPKGTEWMSPTIKWGLVAVGAAGAAYFLYKWFKDEGTGKKASDVVIGGALATIGIGTLLGSENLGKWSADYLNLDVSADAVSDLLSGKGLSSIKFSSREPGIKKAAKELDITERTLIDLKDEKWGDFSSTKEELTRTGLSHMGAALESAGMSNMPGLSVDNDADTAREEIKLESFVKRHQDKIKGDIDKMSIGEILNQLEAAGLFGKPEHSEDNDDKPEGTPEVSADLSRVPTVAGVISSVVSGEMDWDEGLARLMPAADEDGGALGIVNGVLFVAKGTAVVPLSSVNIWVNQVMDMCNWIDGTGSAVDALWEHDQIYWAGTYATAYAAKEIYRGVKGKNLGLGNVLVEAGRGGLQGVIDSYLIIPKTIVKGLKWGTEGRQLADFARLTAKEYQPFISPAEKIHVLHEQTSYYGERYEYYHKKLEIFESRKLTGKAEATIYEKVYGKAWLEKMMEKYAERFIDSRKAFLKQSGVSDTLGADVTLASVKSDKGIQGRLAEAAKKFLTENPKSALPELPAYRVTAPKYATHAEATAAGLPRLAEGSSIPSNLGARMEALGLKSGRITLKLREYGMTKKELEALCTELERFPNPRAAARDLEVVLFQIKNPRLFAGAGALGKAAGIIGTLYMLYDFQESKDKWNTAGEDASMLASFALGARVSSAAIPHPIGKVVGGLVGGTVASFGGQAAWNSYGKPYLQKHFPNRQDFYENTLVSGTGTYLSLVTGGVFLNDLIFAADAMGIGDGIDEGTDPLTYLTESKYVGHPDFIKDVFAGEKLMAMGEHRMHDLSELRSNGQEALEGAQEEILDLQVTLKELTDEELTTADMDRKETIGIKIEEIQKQIEVLERNVIRFLSYTDDSWIEVKQMELVYMQTEMIEPAFQKFQTIVEKKFGAEGLEAFARLMARMQEGRDGTKGDLEMEVWQYLCDQSAELGEGETVSFADFATFTVSIYQSAKQLEEIKKQLALEKGIQPEGGHSTPPVEEKLAA